MWESQENMDRCTDRRDVTKAVESGVKLQTNKQTNGLVKCNMNYGLVKCNINYGVVKCNIVHGVVKHTIVYGVVKYNINYGLVSPAG